jgi:hypothetical protein
MSDGEAVVKAEGPGAEAGGAARWPAGEGRGVSAPVSEAALANAAARAAASASRRDLLEYLRLRRKGRAA